MVKRTKEVRRASSKPILFFGLAWLCGCLILPMISISDYLIVLGLSLAVYGVSKKMIPDEVEVVELELSPLEQMRADRIDHAHRVLAELNEIVNKIDDPKLTQDLKRICLVCSEIVKKMETDDDSNDQSRKLVEHYLPMLIKLLATYDELEETPIQTDNMTQSRENIRKTVALCANAFEKQWDDLHEADSMEISAERDVLESLLGAQGLTETENGVEK